METQWIFGIPLIFLLLSSSINYGYAATTPAGGAVATTAAEDMTTEEPPTTTTRKPIETMPFYMQPILITLVGFGTVFLLLFCACFGCKACASAMCPVTAQRCDDWCTYDCCRFPRVGPCLTKWYRCCCESKRARRRRLRREKRKKKDTEGEWWAYYPGIGWAPAPKDMLPEGAEQPSQWDPAYDYGSANNNQTTSDNWDAGHDYGGERNERDPEQPGVWEADHNYGGQRDVAYENPAYDGNV